MSGKKAQIYLWLGMGIIWILLYRIIFGTFQLSAFQESYQFSISKTEIIEGEKDFERREDTLIALSEDPWISISFQDAIPIKKIILSFSYVKWKDDSGQIYYSLDETISGDFYQTFLLDIGRCEIDLTDDMVKELRLDLTSLEGNEISIPEIQIILGRERQIVYLFSVFILSLIWIVIILMKFYRQWVEKQIEKKPRLKRIGKTIEQILALGGNDFKNRFSGSYLGIFWGIIQPLSTIFLFWFVFQIGFRSQPIEHVPFILWLAAGMIPWNYFYDAWFSGTMAFTSYHYIVKKVVFQVEYLPLVKAFSSAILNLLFNGILLLIYFIYGRFPGIHLLDMFYFSLCVMMLSLGLSYITATLHVFIKDVGQFLGIILQFFMWMTPMMWQYTMIPEKYSWFYKLNPLHYIINGYRESLIYGRWFYTHWVQMIWFWFVTAVLLLVGYRLTKKLKVHFADVL